MLFKLRVYTEKFQTLDLGPHGLRREAVRELVGIVGSWHPLLWGQTGGGIPSEGTPRASKVWILYYYRPVVSI